MDAHIFLPYLLEIFSQVGLSKQCTTISDSFVPIRLLDDTLYDRAELHEPYTFMHLPHKHFGAALKIMILIGYK